MEGEKRNYTEAVFSWQHQEFVPYKKSIWWYGISIAVLALAVWASVFFDNIMFGVFLVLFYLVVLLTDKETPEMIEFTITPDGLKAGKLFHYYKDIDHFYVIYKKDGIKNLYFEFRNPIKGRLIVPLEDQDAVAIRDFLLKYVKEDLDREEEPFSEQIRRIFRL